MKSVLVSTLFKLQVFRGLSRYHYKVKRDNRIQDIGN